MKAKDFFIEFNKRVTGSDKAADTYCKSLKHDGKNFTDYVIGEIKSILRDSSENMKPKSEYYNVDALSWQDIVVDYGEVKKPSGFKDYAYWKPTSAVEHENNSKLWMDEVVKLAYINVPLKVVIGYVKLDENTANYANLEKKGRYVDFVSKAIEHISKHVNKQASESFLLILGNSNCNNNREKYFHYIPYLWNDETCKFELMQKWLNKE